MSARSELGAALLLRDYDVRVISAQGSLNGFNSACACVSSGRKDGLAAGGPGAAGRGAMLGGVRQDCVAIGVVAVVC